MDFHSKVFQKYVMTYTSNATRSRWNDSDIEDFECSESEIKAAIRGSMLYHVEVAFNEKKILTSSCTCPFEGGPVCKHVVHALKEADEILYSNEEDWEEPFIYNGTKTAQAASTIKYVIPDFDCSQLTNTFLLLHSAEASDSGRRGFWNVSSLQLNLNKGVFADQFTYFRSETVSVELKNRELTLSCPCAAPKKKMCVHQAQVLYNLKDREEIRVFFDAELRQQKFKKMAADYGLEQEKELDAYFEVVFEDRKVLYRPKIRELMPVNEQSKTALQHKLLPIPRSFTGEKSLVSDKHKAILVFGQHRYYDHLFVEFMEGKVSKEGNVKNPLKELNPLEFVWKTTQTDELKFYSGLMNFQNRIGQSHAESDVQALRAIVANPLKISCYYHESKLSDNITTASIVPVELRVLKEKIDLNVKLKDKFYEISAALVLDGQSFELGSLKFKFGYFVLHRSTLYLIDDPNVIRVIEYFKKSSPTILIHESKFDEFQQSILRNLEQKIKVNYSFLKKANTQEIKEQALNQEFEKRIYLTDSDDYVLITPIINYAGCEIPVLSERQIYLKDQAGGFYTMNRDEALEEKFLSRLEAMHPDFEYQVDWDGFYLHKQQFLHEAWFLEAFEIWREEKVSVYGFNELKNNRLSPYKMQSSVTVSSGLDWFDTALELRFGDQQVSLKQLQKSIKNKHKYVELGDGTLGLLPDEWMEKFAAYFRTGEVVEGKIRSPKMSFSEISALYDESMLEQDVQQQLALYREKLIGFQEIEEVAVPKGLQAELRDYQKQGLNWLNFLDEFGFGGCLADDMGLGKTIQIIAFILAQREKARENTNLVVVPTTLIFNWQAEVAKFAPSIKIKTIYGTDRVKKTDDFHHYEIILTSYGTLISDIRFLKEYEFNYIFLDESQAIKNPESQRYKSVRLLKSRNKIVLTGTPIENNTFDLYGQFSFACPGLLGSKQHFRDHYSIPIDKFKETKRALELQQKINPFLLRRTKTQVASELPDKTEMVIYCEMGAEQRAVYDAYKQEFRQFLMASSNQKSMLDTMHMLAGLTKLRQICNSPSLLADEEYYGDHSAKLDVLLEEIENKSPYHKMIVFSQFVTMLDLIAKALTARGIPFEYLTGKTKDRSSKVNHFQENEDVRVFLISLKAGGTGLNLTEADYVYLVDPWWNPAVENQAIDRCYRIGQKKNVVAVRLICPDTIEEKIRILQDSKKELARDLVRTDESILKSLNKKDLLSLFDL